MPIPTTSLRARAACSPVTRPRGRPDGGGDLHQRRVRRRSRPRQARRAGPRPDTGRASAARRARRGLCPVLGVTHLETLGYHDSGWTTGSTSHARTCSATCRWRSPWTGSSPSCALPARCHRDLRRHGGYNHPDHLQAHRVTVAAMGAPASRPSCTSRPARRRDWARLRELLGGRARCRRPGADADRGMRQ